MSSEIKKAYVKNPYPGIRSFKVDESHLFFGREKQIGELIDILDRASFVAITGASGSGKSSIIKAGLIPALLQSSENWTYVIFRPGSGLFNNMALAFQSLFQQFEILDKRARNRKEIENTLKNGIDSFIELLEKISFNKKLLIYVDQFEEIFRFRQNQHNSNSKTESVDFVNFLIGASKNTKIKISVVISLRTDFLSDCTDFPALPDVINDGYYLIPKMTLQEKERAFKGPAKIGGAKLSDELSDLLNGHIEKYNINLPVLQHALMRTWDYWLLNSEQSDIVGLEHYNAIGTVNDALSVHAEQIYGKLADDDARKITEKIFKALTYLGDDNRGTRRPASLGEICSITGSREEDVVEIIDVFRAEGNSFLFPRSNVNLNKEVVIDISHESVMRIWKRLIGWVREETTSAQLYLRISKSAELYQNGKTGLLVNPDLLLALKWKKDNSPNEIWAKRYNPAFDRTVNYLEYSDKENKRIVAVKEKKKENTLKRARFFAIFLGSASLISILFLVVALNLQFKAEASEKKAKEKEKIAVVESKSAAEKSKEAISQGKIAEQQQLIAEEQKLLAEAQKIFAVTQQNEAIYQKSLAFMAERKAIKSRDEAVELKKEAEVLRDDALEQKKIAEEQQNRAENSEAKTDTLRRLAISQALAVNAVKVNENQEEAQQLTDEQKQLPLVLALQSYYFNKDFGGNPNNSDIYTALAEVANASTLIRGKNAHSDAVRDIAVSTDGKNFVSCSDDGSLKLHNIDSPTNPKKLKSASIGKVSYRTVLFNNNLIIAGTNKGHIVVWNKNKWQEKPLVLKAHNSVINQIISSQDGGSFYSSSKDGSVKTWNSDNITSVKTIYKTGEKITAIALDKSDNFLAIATESGNIDFVNTSNYSVKQKFKTKNGEILSLCFISNEDLLIGFVSGKIEIRNNENVKEFSAHTSGVTSIIYNDLADRIISCSYDGTIKVWSLINYDTEPPLIIDKHDSWVYSIALTPDKTKIISGSADKNILITSIDIEELKAIVRKKVNTNMSEKDWLKYVGTGIEYNSELPK